ncbi:MAG: zinc-binding alcohol dehydrogenase family protein [Desulfobulbaceae bacterium]|nr:zinc-binding alcohol dehydrogenase family protein [Desulfobulbaceae bacterium]
MNAQLLNTLGDLRENSDPLEMRRVAIPEPREGEILIRVSACGVCHTELDEIEGRTPPPSLPVIPGHQVVGRVERTGPEATRFQLGDRVGVAWIFSACGTCSFCRRGRENLCSEFKATGRDADGGYAEFMVVPEAFAYPLPDSLTDYEAAPLLCAGAIGYRSLHLTGLENGQSFGLTGFGGSGHLVLKMVQHRYPDSRVYVFARSPVERAFALELGAVWAGDTAEKPPELLQAIIDTTPAWKPVISAMSSLKPGGRLVINAIRKERRDQQALMKLDYPGHLWMEKEIKSVANVCRSDVSEFLQLAAEMQIKPEVEVYPLADANQAVYELKTGHIRGAKVLAVA